MIKTERVNSIDLLRGIAVLGILIMNIQSFSMPGSAYINPTSYGDLSGSNKMVWLFSHILADTKFMSLFSLLFGAGIILLTDKVISTNRPLSRIWYSRLFWLFIFGLCHVIFLWQGDILIMYALCGFIAFFFRKKSPKFLMRIAIVFFIIPILINLMQGLSWEHIPPEAIDEIRNSWHPTQSFQSDVVAIFTGDSFTKKMDYRIMSYVGLFIYYFLFTGLWRILAMMFFGMYFYKTGALNANWESEKYKKLIYLFLPLGLGLIGFGVWYNFNHDWAAEYSMFLGVIFNYIGSLFLAISYMSITMLWSKSERLNGAKRILQKTGRMAFTNYILMSTLATTFFYRFGHFGNTSRLYQLGITFAIWAFLLAFTHLWLKKFKMGPLEWLWRSLTYWKMANIT